MDNSIRELTDMPDSNIAITVTRYQPDKKASMFRNHWHEQIELLTINRGSMVRS